MILKEDVGGEMICGGTWDRKSGEILASGRGAEPEQGG